jgi:hypothetical protein
MRQLTTMPARRVGDDCLFDVVDEVDVGGGPPSARKTVERTLSHALDSRRGGRSGDGSGRRCAR